LRPAVREWFVRSSSRSGDWGLDRLLAGRLSSAATVSVVIPARNEAATIGPVVSQIRSVLMEQTGLIDELIVMDSLSSDATAAIAADLGAAVHSVAEVRPDLGVHAGKGEALWKSQFVTTGEILVFIDADLTEWGTHFVSSLMGPLLEDEHVLLVKGFYDRLLETERSGRSTEGGRVTELVARPLLAAFWPDICAVVQPLAGEWAIRRSLFATLPVPVGYGVELATLIDTVARHGLTAVAQVDLGVRGHRHQAVHDLAAMALELLCVADARRGTSRLRPDDAVVLAQFRREVEDCWVERTVPVTERPPVSLLAPSA
jgi:glucosyl-3-phosphoglycerate synthase